MAEDGSGYPSASKDIVRTKFLINYVIGRYVALLKLHIPRFGMTINKGSSAFHKYSPDLTHARGFENR